MIVPTFVGNDHLKTVALHRIYGKHDGYVLIYDLWSILSAFGRYMYMVPYAFAMH